MDTNPTPVPTPDPAKTKIKGVSTSLTSPAGKDGPSLRFTMLAKSDGTYSTFATYVEKGKDGKSANKKGATSTHATVEAAKKAMDELIAAAVAKGWVQRRTGRATAKPDAFDLAGLPAAPKAAPASAPAPAPVAKKK
jgi:hypothetical protein